MRSYLLKLFFVVMILCKTTLSFSDEVPNYYFPPSVDDETKEELISAADKLMTEAKELIAHNEINKGIALLKVVLQLLPNDYRPYQLLTEFYSHYGKFDFFLSALEQSMRYYTDSDALIPPALAQYLQNNPVMLTVPQGPYIANFKDDKPAAISFMFDDGELDVATDVVPLFKKLGFRMTIPINPGVTPDVVSNPWRGSWEQWKQAHADGFEIANHSMNHRDLTKVYVTDDVMEIEINKSYDLIKEKIGKAPTSFIFPFNMYNEKSTQYATQRHVYLREHELLFPLYPVFLPVYGGPAFSVKTANAIVDFSIKERLWLQPICHGMVTKEIKKSYKSVTHDFLLEHLTYIQQRESELWVDTVANVFAYINTKAAATLVIEDKKANSCRFQLTADKPVSENQQLTVVIPVDTIPTKVSAKNQKTNDPIPVIIKDKSLMLSVGLNSVVDVTW